MVTQHNKMLSPHINIQRPSTDLSSGGRGRGGKVPSTQQLLAESSSNHGPQISIRSRENSQGSGSVYLNSPRGSFQLYIPEGIVIKWPEKHMDRAPELALLSKTPSAFHAYSGDCFSKLFRMLATLCKTFNRVGDSALANFKPIESRTDHTLEYVNGLAREYAINLKYGSQPHIGSSVVIKTPSGTTIKSDAADLKAAGKTSSTNTKQKLAQQQQQQAVKNQLLKDFYDKSYRTLSVLQQCIGHFRTIIHTLTFTRYAEEDLTDSEAKMIRGKSIIGSCIWVVACALQQLQEDPEVEQSEYLSKINSDLVEIGLEMHSLITLSLHTWHDILLAVGAVDRVHRKTEDLFQRQTTRFRTKNKPESEAADIAGYHSRQYRRQGNADTEQLRNFKGFDPYASLLTWNNKRQGPSRILYITDYTDPDSLWYGFDPLSVDKKIPFLRDILNFIKLVLEAVRETAQKLLTDLHGHEMTPNTLNTNRTTAFNYTGISSYDDGIDAMDEILTKKLDEHDWNCDEMYEFFETDKIFLDDMDLLALAATITRAILFEAKHTMHVCYETCRLLDYKEFMNLPSYEKIYRKVKEGYGEDNSRNQSKFGKKGKKWSIGTTTQYDTDQMHIELRNVAGLFRTSHYREILKNLPVYTNTIGITLQDAEMVFTPSSEKLLS